MTRLIFTPETKVKLYYLLCKIFPSAVVSRGGYDTRGGEKQAELEERLRERLGLLSLAKGHSIDEKLKNFILGAPDDHITLLLELIPVVAYPHDAAYDEQRHKVQRALEEFVERTAGASIKFGEDGRPRLDAEPQAELVAQRPQSDVLEALIGQKERVAIFYFLEEQFEPGTYDATIGDYDIGSEQEMLEIRLRKRLKQLKLADGRRPEEILKTFVTEKGTPREILAMLELMPGVRCDSLQDSHFGGHAIEQNVAAIRSGIIVLLRSMGIEMAFTPDGKIEEAAVDKTPRALKELPTSDQLKGQLSTILADWPVVSLVSLDLDNFKVVNDRHGHDAGDECLVGFAELVGHILKGKGRLFRSYKAGDEFSILLPNFDEAEALAVAERIRKAVESSNIGRDVSITASVGVVTSRPGDDGDLAAAADEAAFAAKFSGKNRVVVWPLDPGLAENVRIERDKAKGR